ncbi:hypothetical protein [Deinococcus misasensis]|uniref:hypothetical protein n=1 Tax=Deinococcus misasensis TaxID=392413 RepID=UPI000553E8D9|nr:hypothetical protein [Deinococcus misasensis]
MNAAARAWLFGLIGLGGAGLVAFAPLPWEYKLVLWVVLLNITGDLGGRWFAYLGLLLGGLGFFNPTDAWWTTFPLMLFVTWAFLVLKHTLRVYGVVLGLLMVFAVFAALKIAVPLMDPELKLLTSNSFMMPALVAFLISSIFHVWVYFASRTNTPQTSAA